MSNQTQDFDAENLVNPMEMVDNIKQFLADFEKQSQDLSHDKSLLKQNIEISQNMQEQSQFETIDFDIQIKNPFTEIDQDNPNNSQIENNYNPDVDQTSIYFPGMDFNNITQNIMQFQFQKKKEKQNPNLVFEAVQEENPNDVTNLSNVMMHEISLNYSDDRSLQVNQTQFLILNTYDNKAKLF